MVKIPIGTGKPPPGALHSSARAKRYWFGAVSIGDITSAAGFTKGAFYSNFESREAMLLELLRQVHVQQRGAMTELESEAPPSDLSHALDRLTEIAMRHINSPSASLLIAEMQLEARRNPPSAGPVRTGFEEQVNRFAGWIDKVVKSARHRAKLSSHELARIVMAVSQGLALQPTDRADVKAMMRNLLGRLFEERFRHGDQPEIPER